MAIGVFADELVRIHREYVKNVPNNYAATIPQIKFALSSGNYAGAAAALSEWLKNINLQYYRFRPAEARVLSDEVEKLLRAEWNTLQSFRERSVSTLQTADEPAVNRLFRVFRAKLGPVGAAKALHVLAPEFFPMWDNAIASGYGFTTDGGYFQFMFLAKQQLAAIPGDLIPGLSLLKAFDEYNYYRFSAPKQRGSGN